MHLGDRAALGGVDRMRRSVERRGFRCGIGSIARHVPVRGAKLRDLADREPRRSRHRVTRRRRCAGLLDDRIAEALRGERLPRIERCNRVGPPRNRLDPIACPRRQGQKPNDAVPARFFTRMLEDDVRVIALEQRHNSRPPA